MKLRVPFAIAVLGALSLACSGLGGKDEEAATTEEQPAPEEAAAEEAPAEEAATLVEPWSSMNLPVEDGEIVSADADALEVRYAGKAWSEVGDGFLSALTGAGWTKAKDESTAEGLAVSLEKDGKTVKLEASSDGDAAVVRLVAGPSAENARTRPARRGKAGKIGRGKMGGGPRAGVRRGGGHRAEGSGSHTPGSKSTSSSSHTPGGKSSSGTKSSSSGSHTPGK